MGMFDWDDEGGWPETEGKSPMPPPLSEEEARKLLEESAGPRPTAESLGALAPILLPTLGRQQQEWDDALYDIQNGFTVLSALRGRGLLVDRANARTAAEMERNEIHKHIVSQMRSAYRRSIESGGDIPFHEAWHTNVQELIQEFADSRPTPAHTLGPLETRKGFVPGNVGWRSPLEVKQAMGAVIVTDTDGERLTLPELARKHKMQVTKVKQRYRTLMGRDDDLSKLVGHEHLSAKRIVPYMGMNVTIPELAILTGISQHTLRSRWEKGVRGPELIEPPTKSTRNVWSAEGQVKREALRLKKKAALLEKLKLSQLVTANREESDHE